MKILIVEDESLAANRLEDKLKLLRPESEVVAKIGSIKESVSWLLNHTVDLIFLDIQLSDGLSFVIFEQVPVQTPIIFTTAYDQYAIKAFELNSIAYLLKPIKEGDLQKSLTKFEKLKSTFRIDFENLVSSYFGKDPEYKNRFLIKIGDKFEKIEVKDIAYCFAKDKDVYAKTFNNRTIPMEYSLDALEAQLDPARYFRINRKYIVNMDAIEKMFAISRTRIKLKLNPQSNDEFGSTVSIQRSADFKKWIDT